MARIYSEKEFIQFTRHYTPAEREEFRQMLIEEGRLIVGEEKSQERKAMEAEDALLGEIMNGEDTKPQHQQKKEAEAKGKYPSIKLTADAITRKITPAEFSRLFWNLSEEERREVRSDLILEGKYDPDEESKPEKPMTDAEIDELAEL